MLGNLLAIVITIFSSSVFAESPMHPETPFNFTHSIGKFPLGAVDLAAHTITSLNDKDGDRIVGGIIRITLATGVEGPNNSRIWSFVNAIVVDCNPQTMQVIQLRSSMHDKNGKHVVGLSEIKIFNDENDSTSLITLARKALCSSKVLPTPIGEDSISKGYKSFWQQQTGISV